MERHILVVLPHPDDEAFGLSGTLAMHIQKGTQVTYACLTLGEMGRNMGVPPFANRVTLPGIRKQELEESCAAIGIQDLRLLGCHDKMVEFEDPEQLDGRIGDLIRELDPSLIITFYPGYSVHPDHDACGAAVIRTVQRLPKDQRPRVDCLAIVRGDNSAIGKPDVTHDVSAFIGNKRASMEAHRSQFRAAELLGDGQLTDEEIRMRFGKEKFWTYRFDQSGDKSNR